MQGVIMFNFESTSLFYLQGHCCLCCLCQSVDIPKVGFGQSHLVVVSRRTGIVWPPTSSFLFFSLTEDRDFVLPSIFSMLSLMCSSMSSYWFSQPSSSSDSLIASVNRSIRLSTASWKKTCSKSHL